ncbi:hypothetical protein [Meiothermus ruber]|uniref:Uncharacterized protein n=1 Tax=Meiothermus ruber (strain ATCC 35948 / DSM 1279 / VKM B-1258 / 21) TaxID=504728 RepID=D3PTF2_MEIRD|nr:hypothetical protein [Meiothermus ruber]ADD28735.1 hypothetical protein Mrub_1979 [Meiothermus ruber DSM 1279]AGK05817.1 hypothetical protein K649_12655 [Meiothermus ruber DSM 1279]
MPSAQALARLRQAQAQKQDNTAQVLAFLHDHELTPVRLRSASIEVLVRYEGLGPTAEGGAEPLYGIHLPSTGEWLTVGRPSLEGYLKLYGPYTWEATHA